MENNDLELSGKMEENLLENKATSSTFKKSPQNHYFSTRLTRSKTVNSRHIPFVEEPTKSKIRRNHSKEDDIEKLYLNKKVKIVHKNLETIYEQPICKRGNSMLLGTSKVKRFIYLDREFRITSKQKSKLRKLKIKRLGKRIKPSRMTEDEFKKRMMMVDNFINENDVEINCDNEDFIEVSFENNYNEDFETESSNTDSNGCEENNCTDNKDVKTGENCL